MHVVIGNGALGQATATALAAAGQPVRVISRSGSVRSADIETVRVDVRHPDALARAVRGASCIYQCAQPAYPQWIAEFGSLQAAVLDAAVSVGADLVLGDNLYGYGKPEGVITEDSPRVPVTRKGRLRAAMADTALAAHRAGRLRVALVRPANYIGPGYERTMADLVRPARAGRPLTMLGSLDEPHSFSYVPDAGRALAAVGLSEDGWGSAWIAPVLPPVTQRALAGAIWAAAGREGEPSVRRLTRRGAAILGLFQPTVRELVEMMYEFDEPFVVDSGEMARRFGVRATGFDEAIRDTVAADILAPVNRNPPTSS